MALGIPRSAWRLAAGLVSTIGLLVLAIAGQARTPNRCEPVDAGFQVERFLSEFMAVYRVELAPIPDEDFSLLYRYGVPEVRVEAVVLETLHGTARATVELPVRIRAEGESYSPDGYRGFVGVYELQFKELKLAPPLTVVTRGCANSQLAAIFADERLRQRAIEFLGR